MADWTHFFIHCSDTPPSMDVKPKHIYRWHIKQNGWSRVGYSLMVRRSGHLDIMVPFDRDDVIDSWEISNGAAGWNGRSKHMCLVGGKSVAGKKENNFNAAQMEMASGIVRIIVMLYPEIKIIGHNQVNKGKYCPSFDVPKWCKKIGINPQNIDKKIYY